MPIFLQQSPHLLQLKFVGIILVNMCLSAFDVIRHTTRAANKSRCCRERLDDLALIATSIHINYILFALFTIFVNENLKRLLSVKKFQQA